MKLILLTFALMLTIVGAETKMPEDAVLFKKKYYKHFTVSCSWHEAEKKCVEMGGLLVSIKDKETDLFLRKLSKSKAYWAGASDELEEGKWLWRDGSPVTYSNWEASEPDNWKGTEDWLVISWGGRFLDKWADTDSTPRGYVKGFICEWSQKNP